VLGEPTGRERTQRAASLLEYGFQTRAWQALFNPPTLASMPLAADAKGPMTMRQAVVSYECGTARRRVAKVHKKTQQGAGDKGPAARRAVARKAAAPAAKSQ